MLMTPSAPRVSLRRLLPVVALSLACGFSVARVAICAEPPPASPAVGLEVGQRAPGFSAKDLSGAMQSLEAHQGQPIIVHFWATWCPYCRGEIPKLKQIHQDHGKDVAILAISVDESVERLQKFVHAMELPYPVISEVQNRQPLSDLYEIGGVPTTYLLNAKGIIVERFEGQGDLQPAVEQVLKRGR